MAPEDEACFEAVFIAGTVDEVDTVEKLLGAEEIVEGRTANSRR